MRNYNFHYIVKAASGERLYKIIVCEDVKELKKFIDRAIYTGYDFKVEIIEG